MVRSGSHSREQRSSQVVLKRKSDGIPSPDTFSNNRKQTGRPEIERSEIEHQVRQLYAGRIAKALIDTLRNGQLNPLSMEPVNVWLEVVDDQAGTNASELPRHASCRPWGSSTRGRPAIACRTPSAANRHRPWQLPSPARSCSALAFSFHGNRKRDGRSHCVHVQLAGCTR